MTWQEVTSGKLSFMFIAEFRALKVKYEKEIDDIRDQYDRQNLQFKLEKLEEESYKTLNFELSSPDDSHVSEFSVKVSELNDKYLNINQMHEEALMTIRRLESQIEKMRQDSSNENCNKDKVISKLEKRITDVTKRLKNQEKNNKQV